VIFVNTIVCLMYFTLEFNGVFRKPCMNNHGWKLGSCMGREINLCNANSGYDTKRDDIELCNWWIRGNWCRMVN